VSASNLLSLDSIHSQTELARKKSVELVGEGSGGPAAGVSDDENETVVSGCGAVTKECGEEELLDWSDLLSRWRRTTWNERPKGLQSLVRKGKLIDMCIVDLRSNFVRFVRIFYMNQKYFF